MRKTIFAVLLAAMLASAYSAEQVSGESKKIYRGSACAPKISCTENPALPETLKEFGLRVKNWRFPAGTKDDFEIFNSTAYAWYETADRMHLEDFAFVQYVRGCVYSSEKSPDGTIAVHYGVLHQQFGKHKLFLHPDWVVDSPVVDPMFGSSPKQSVRHYFMEWNKNPEQFPSSHGSYYGDNPPTTSRLFMLFSPTSPAYALRNGTQDVATNHSLEYRTCLYRTKDIPKESEGSIIPGALGCFDWKSSYVYDHALRKYSSPEGIMDACRPEKLPDMSILDELNR